MQLLFFAAFAGFSNIKNRFNTQHPAYPIILHFRIVGEANASSERTNAETPTTYLYMDVMPEPMTIYLDEYRKKEIVE